MPAPTVGRITTRAAFAELQRSRARGSSGSVRAVFVPAPSSAAAPHDRDVFPQVGYAVSRHCGSAVVRNRLRRQARAVVRAEASSLSPGRYLLRFSPESAVAPAATYRADVAEAMRRAGRSQAVRAG